MESFLSRAGRFNPGAGQAYLDSVVDYMDGKTVSSNRISIESRLKEISSIVSAGRTLLDNDYALETDPADEMFKHF